MYKTYFITSQFLDDFFDESSKSLYLSENLYRDLVSNFSRFFLFYTQQKWFYFQTISKSTVKIAKKHWKFPWNILFIILLWVFENKQSNSILRIEYTIQKYQLDDLHDSALNESNSFEVNFLHAIIFSWPRIQIIHHNHWIFMRFHFIILFKIHIKNQTFNTKLLTFVHHLRSFATSSAGIITTPK